ncbi:MAG: hypothetical protein R3B13_13660 [Polyangiaceae bacterium]
MVAGVQITSCLPTDTRPEPGTLNVVGETEARTLEGFSTDDGWTMRFERMLVSVGHSSAEGDDCTSYNDPDYARVLDALRPGQQKINTVFCQGFCELDIELSSPNAESALGAGVTAADRDLLRTPGKDAYVPEGGLSVLLDGTATKGGTDKHFAWAYRNRIDYSVCQHYENGVLVGGLRVVAKQTTTTRVTFHASAPFQQQLEPKDAMLGFEHFAAADADQDGEVTLDELARVSLGDIETQDRFADAKPGWATLADYVYLGLFPKLVRYEDDGVCELEVFPNDRAPR